ncbi:DUF881 domain-containing protein [Raineyella sp. W15-4]|uniref:DUF881 domain-containing protein n=1 Tax=Raineyella sp. W15-4 TaxID=3081651 RepID=UPI0029542629|nr:DUF881 domain-containing protein [Raineyella sp. W15-4]WOQ18557.1 DUF881 domain-containing protein [Raineyella sp. W15-4]
MPDEEIEEPAEDALAATEPDEAVDDPEVSESPSENDGTTDTDTGAADPAMDSAPADHTPDDPTPEDPADPTDTEPEDPEPGHDPDSGPVEPPAVEEPDAASGTAEPETHEPAAADDEELPAAGPAPSIWSRDHRPVAAEPAQVEEAEEGVPESPAEASLETSHDPATDEPATDEPAADHHDVPDHGDAAGRPEPAGAPSPEERETAPTADGADAAVSGPAAAEPVPEPADEPVPEPAGTTPPRPTLRDWLRPERTQVVVAIVLAVVAFGIVTQIRTRGQVDSYSSLRQSDLVGMLDGLNQESQRLQSELESLQTARDQLQSGQDNEALARAQAEDRLTALGILAGTIPAHGPGITITITDPQGKVKPAMILDALEEMRDAGGEVMQINGRIRVVASTWVGSGASGIVVDGQAVSTPITLEVIGDAHALEEAARFRGGLVSQITDPRVGGQVTIVQSDNLSITSLHTVRSPQFARTDQSAGTGTGKGN